MNNIVITPEGLFFLERIVRSCTPTLTNGGMLGKEYLLSLVKNGSEITYDEFKRSFPKSNFNCTGLYNVYDQLESVATEIGKNKIDANFILDFFSGDYHIERAGCDVKGSLFNGMKENYVNMEYISHILLPVEISEIGTDFFSAKYSNGNCFFEIKNLVAFQEEKEKIKIGDVVLAHYASIVFSGLEKDVEVRMLSVQARNVVFMDACRLISEAGIDHSKMLHFPWAKKLVTECGN
jgi:hypothetical protein